MAEKIARRRRQTKAEEADLCLALHAGIYLRLKSEENASMRESTPKNHHRKARRGRAGASGVDIGIMAPPTKDGALFALTLFNRKRT